MRLKPCFKRLEDEGRKALIPYILGGDPAGKTVEIMHQLISRGADIIELGFPFSDPMADGPVIAQAHERTVKQGVTLNDVLSMVATFRQSDNKTPVILMGYLNPIEVMGYDVFVGRASQAGVDGVLIVDLPPEFSEKLLLQLHVQNMDLISLITPTTSDERIKKICKVASGYLYYVSLKGVTGSSALNVQEVQDRVSHIKSFSALPVSVGFGIRDGQSAAAISRIADGVVVGTVLVSELAKFEQEGDTCIHSVSNCVAEMRSAMDA